MTDDSFYAGMIAYEQLCEEMLMRSILPDWYKRFVMDLVKIQNIVNIPKA